jgi:SAM-dependent methyltransferase
MIPHFFDQIDGWFDFRDIYAEALAEAGCQAKFVEVGSWYGRSAAWMAVEIANSGKGIEFFCVDTWKGSADLPWMANHLRGSGGSAKPKFLENLKRGGVMHLVRPIELPSVEAAQLFAAESLDFVFIDAAHDYESVRADVRAWYSKVKPGGVIAGDDAGWPGVRIGVHETIPDGALVLRNDARQWWHRKRRRQPGTWLQQRVGNRTDCFAYIPFVNNHPLLDSAVRSVERLWPSLVVIDQSASGVEAEWVSEIAGLYRVPYGTISFTEMMNWAQQEAFERGAKVLVFMHSDAECSDALVAAEVTDLARNRSAEKIGAIFTHYDALAVFNVEALRDTGPWDETFRWYFGDNDYYRRLQLNGWRAVEFGGDRVRHRASQTLGSDPQIHSRVIHEWDWTLKHYVHKWGGPPGGERFTIPYNGKP